MGWVCLQRGGFLCDVHVTRSVAKIQQWVHSRIRSWHQSEKALAVKSYRVRRRKRPELSSYAGVMPESVGDAAPSKSSTWYCFSDKLMTIPKTEPRTWMCWAGE